MEIQEWGRQMWKAKKKKVDRKKRQDFCASSKQQHGENERQLQLQQERASQQYLCKNREEWMERRP